MYGIASLKTFSRRIVSADNSRLKLQAPRVKQDLSTPSTPGSDGDDGRHGFDGTRGLRFESCLKFFKMPLF